MLRRCVQTIVHSRTVNQVLSKDMPKMSAEETIKLKDEYEKNREEQIKNQCQVVFDEFTKRKSSVIEIEDLSEEVVNRLKIGGYKVQHTGKKYGMISLGTACATIGMSNLPLNSGIVITSIGVLSTVSFFSGLIGLCTGLCNQYEVKM